MSDFNLIPILPEIFMAMAAMGLLIVGVVHGNASTKTISWSSVVACIFTLLILLKVDAQPMAILNNMFVMDGFASFMKMLILIGSGLSIALSVRYLQDEDIARFEYPILVLMAGSSVSAITLKSSEPLKP